MKHAFFYMVTAILMALLLISFWAGLAFVILAACKVIAITVKHILLVWLVVSAVLIPLLKWFYGAAEKAERDEAAEWAKQNSQK